MKVKTAELTGAALDWAVAKCEGFSATGYEARRLKMKGASFEIPKHWQPSTDWAQGGPIIERVHINILAPEETGCWSWIADKGLTRGYSGGPDRSPLIAAMRCYVASKLGDDIEIPEELMQ